ncbi:uncharacterized protein troap isoform X2 [Triplophysa rosa]|uniref:uncharacterized protein troap isoform X2 n=1 Tax=Triplophysa rosa TaxID=992332 RepID=UPI002545BF87|nr:uncharacterized protein troap isoform X2 [Triplophysa rosa]
MASSNPLRLQNRSLQNQTGILKKQEVNKLTAVASSKRGSENLDPNASAEGGKGVNKLKGVSRLPVLAKSLQPAGNDLSPQNRWEQRPLSGKAQKKRICTKPVPFNLSQSRTHSQRNTDVPCGKAPLTPSARLKPGAKLKSHKAATPGVFRSASKSQSAVPRTVGHMEHTTSTKPTSLDASDGHPTITASHESRSCSQTDLSSRLGSITLVQSKLPEDLGLSHLCKDSLNNVGVGSSGQAPKDKNCIQIVQSASGTQSHAGTKAMHNVLSCEGLNTVGALSVMPRLSTCLSGPGSSNNLPQRISVKKSQHDVVNTTGNAGAFSPDPSALRNILQSDAMRVVERVGATPRISTCPTGRPTSFYSAQRVPVKKPQTDDIAAVTGSSVTFSPDPSALRSILQNEGVRVGALGGATPRVSTCPTGRGTSIYSAQRVPVKKTKTEETSTASYCANRTPVRTWTPWRVANTKSQSTMKILSAQRMSRFRDSPGFSTQLLMHEEQEDVVQRLFDDPDQLDNDQMGEKVITSKQLLTTSTSHQTIEPLTNKEILKSNHRHNEDEGKKTGQPFIQAAHRGSVIVFSSSQRLCGSDRPQEAPVIENSTIAHITLQSNQTNGSQVTSSSDVTKQINTCTQSQLKVTFTFVHSASALRRRHIPLEEMILDEECATYTTRLLSCPLQPRCGNPVATTLLFQDSTCFLPIGLTFPIRLSPVPSGSSIRA